MIPTRGEPQRGTKRTNRDEIEARAISGFIIPRFVTLVPFCGSAWDRTPGRRGGPAGGGRRRGPGRAIEFVCPGCHGGWGVSAAAAGGVVRCGSCLTPARAPASSGNAAPAPPPVPPAA